MMTLVVMLLLSLLALPCKAVNEPDEIPVNLDNRTESKEPDPADPTLPLQESHGEQAASEDTDIALRSATSSQEASEDTDIALRSATSSQPYGVDIDLVADKKLESSQDIEEEEEDEEQEIELGKAKDPFIFTATEKQAETEEEVDYYDIEHNEEPDQATREILDILKNIESQGLKTINSSRIERSFGRIQELPFGNISVLSRDRLTIYQGSPTSQIPYLEQVATISNGRPVLIKVFIGAPCFVFLDPVGQRFCLIFSVSLSDLSPSLFEWFLQEILQTVMSQVVTFCLNEVTGSCTTNILKEFLWYIISFILWICFILCIPIYHYVIPNLEEIEMNCNLNEESLQGVRPGCGNLSIREIVRQIRFQGHRFILEKENRGTSASQSGTASTRRNKQAKKKTKGILISENAAESTEDREIKLIGERKEKTSESGPNAHVNTTKSGGKEMKKKTSESGPNAHVNTTKSGGKEMKTACTGPIQPLHQETLSLIPNPQQQAEPQQQAAQTDARKKIKHTVRIPQQAIQEENVEVTSPTSRSPPSH